MVGAQFPPFRCNRFTLIYNIGTAGMEATPCRRVNGAGNVTRKGDVLDLALWVMKRDGRHKRLRVGMERAGIEVIG